MLSRDLVVGTAAATWLLVTAPAVAAQTDTPAPGGAEAPRSAEAWTADRPPPGYGAAVAGPDSDLGDLPERTWSDLAALSDEALEAETSVLKGERSARLRAVARLQEEMQDITDSLRKGQPREQTQKLTYRRALLKFRVAVENREVRQINDRLEDISKERVRRRPEPAGPVPEDPTALDSVRQAKAVVELLAKYDEALLRVLRREPLRESDVIYALGLLDEKAPVRQALADYVDLLEHHAAGAETPAAEAAP